jgi:hypothetical protein
MRDAGLPTDFRNGENEVGFAAMIQSYVKL